MEFEFIDTLVSDVVGAKTHLIDWVIELLTVRRIASSILEELEVSLVDVVLVHCLLEVLVAILVLDSDSVCSWTANVILDIWELLGVRVNDFFVHPEDSVLG